jgi:hypothetical protein
MGARVPVALGMQWVNSAGRTAGFRGTRCSETATGETTAKRPAALGYAGAGPASRRRQEGGQAAFRSQRRKAASPRAIVRST